MFVLSGSLTGRRRSHCESRCRSQEGLEIHSFFLAWIHSLNFSCNLYCFNSCNWQAEAARVAADEAKKQAGLSIHISFLLLSHPHLSSFCFFVFSLLYYLDAAKKAADAAKEKADKAKKDADAAKVICWLFYII